MEKKLILIINAGSSSLKFKLFTDKLRERGDGIVEKIGLPGSFFYFQFSGRPQKVAIQVADHFCAMQQVMNVLAATKYDLRQIKKIGHRVVHGGEKFIAPTRLTPAIIKQIEKFNQLAPLHNPQNLAAIKACRRLLPTVEQWAVFDTAFHATMPDYAYLYPVPLRMYKKYHIRRYGFHGISHQYVSLSASRLLKKAKPNLIVCHLGSGCSLTAVKQGRSVDTSMGFTPLEGLMMSTRSGDVDPAIVFYLQRQGLTSAAVEELLNKQAGWQGVAGLKDMRDILLASGYQIAGYRSAIKFTTAQRRLASLALKMFVYRVVKYIGAYQAVLGRVDAIVFTAGIGERNRDIRRLIMATGKFHLPTLVIPTNEELMIAQLISRR